MFIFIIFFLISLCGKTRENFYRSVALNILNTIKTFNTTNRTSRFLFEDHCNSSKNPSSEIHIPLPKQHLSKILKKIYIIIRVIFSEDEQELIKRISLNTWILIVVFNGILIPQDFFFEDNCNSSKNPSSEIHIFIIKSFYLKFHNFIFLYTFFFCILENIKAIITSHDMPEWCVKIKCLKKNQNNSYQNTKQNNELHLWQTLFCYFLWIH